MQALLIERVAQRLDHVLLPDQRLERARTPLAGENLVRHDRFSWIFDPKQVASLTPGTCNDQLWLLPSGPDQVHWAAMRGGPP